MQIIGSTAPLQVRSSAHGRAIEAAAAKLGLRCAAETFMVLSIAAARFCAAHAHHEYIAAWPAEGPSLLAWPAWTRAFRHYASPVFVCMENPYKRNT